jgi:carbon storage regulator
MLVLTRKSNQSIMIGDDVEVSVLSVVGDKVRIGIQAPQSVPVFRTEIYLEIQRQGADGTTVVAAETTQDADQGEVDEALRELGDPS